MGGKDGYVVNEDGALDWDDNKPRPTRSSKKRVAQEALGLGERLMACREEELDILPLSEELQAALCHCHTIQKRIARRRQMLLIGKLLRCEDTKAIELALGDQSGEVEARAARLRALERWRSRLIDDGDPALEAFLVDFPNCDRQRLRQACRKAQQQKPGAAQKLFKLLREFAGIV